MKIRQKNIFKISCPLTFALQLKDNESEKDTGSMIALEV